MTGTMHVAQHLIFSPVPGRGPLCVEDGPGAVDDCGALIVPAGTIQGIGTYLNGLPAAYWAAWTGARRARLQLQAEGPGTVRLLRSGSAGAVSEVATAPVGEPVDVDLPFDDVGWLWCEVSAGDEDVVVTGGTWWVDAPVRRGGDVVVSITTMDKPDYCVATLRTLASCPELDTEDVRVQVVDQGSDKVVDHDGFAEVSELLGDRLRVVDQSNVGGSGGFSRGMLETLDADADAVLICDDDVEVEPECLLRAVRFHRMAEAPVVVGGHMFDLARPTVLNSFSEVVHRRTFNWGPPRMEHQWQDLAGGLRSVPWLHRRQDSEFNGWWMCLIPADTLRAVGLSMPFFLKWDDAEFCLRAGEAGYPTVSLPGACLWHMAWTEKDDSVEWQAYLHVRNRVATALLHATAPRLLPLALLATDLKLLLAMRYYPVELHLRALREIADGPGRLHPGLDSVVGQVRAAGTAFPETVRHVPGDEVYDTVAARRTHEPPAPRPRGPLGLLVFAVRGSARAVRSVSGPGRRGPTSVLTREQAVWWEVPGHDSVLVLDATQDSGVWLRRDRAAFWRLGVRAVVAHARLALTWRRLARRWREDAPELVSPERWRATLASPGAD